MKSYMTGDIQRGATKILEAGAVFPVVEVCHDIWSFITVSLHTKEVFPRLCFMNI